MGEQQSSHSGSRGTRADQGVRPTESVLFGEPLRADLFQRLQILLHPARSQRDITVLSPAIAIPGAGLERVVTFFAPRLRALAIVAKRRGGGLLSGQVPHLVRVAAMVEEQLAAVAMINRVGMLVIAQ